MPEAEQQVVIEDPSGSKITVARDSRHEVLVTFSGHIIPEDLSEGNQIGTRRTVTNKVLSIRHFDDQKDILSEIIESEEFRDCQREDSELRTFSFALAGNVRCGFEDGQFYIEVHNTKGRRAIIFFLL